MEFIDLKHQYNVHKEAIDKAISKVLNHGKFILGPEVKELESALAKFVNSKYCLAVASGTDALLIALMALKIDVDDEIVTTPFTWISTSEVIALLKAKPVFSDIDPKTFNLDPKLIEKKITKKTKAILPVSLFGQICDLEEITKIAKKYNLFVIEDAAQSFGAKCSNIKSCSFADVSTTSFFPAKPLGGYGDGGAVFTNAEDIYEKMLAIRNHGEKKRHHHEYIGINGRMDTLQAAIVLEKLSIFKDELKKKNDIATRYNEGLCDCVSITYKAEEDYHSYAQYTIRSKNRDALIEALKKENIPSAIHYPKCLHEQPAFHYLGYKYGDFPHAEKASNEVLSLPMHPYLSIKDQEKIVNTIRNFTNKMR